jgi:hypothetical protein
MSRRSRNNNPPARTTQNPGSDYSSWLMLVPKDKRKEIAKFITEHPVENYDDLVSFGCRIMAALMEGRITPVIAQELRHWHELNFTILAAKNTAAGTPQNAYTDIVTALVQVKRETKQLRGDYFDANDLVETSEPIAVEVKNGRS